MALIDGVGLVTPAGIGRAAFLAAWAGGAGIEPLAAGPMQGCRPVTDALPLKELLPESRSVLRRMDRLSKLVCAGAALCRDDAGVVDVAELALGVGTALGTIDGTWTFLNRLRERGPALASPSDFPNLVPNAGAGYLGIFLGATGPSHTFCQHEVAGEDAIAWAADQVDAGRVPGAIAGGAEELGEVRRRATAVAGCPVGAALSEGAAFVHLTATPRRPLARWLGAAGRFHRARLPVRLDADADAVAATVRAALDRAGVAASRVGVALTGPVPSPELEAGVDAALPGVPRTDLLARFGSWPSDGALRVALAALLLADPELPLDAAGTRRSGDVAVVVSVARGGSVRASVLGQA